MTETDKQPSLEKWDDFAGEYLKADIITKFPLTVVAKSMESEYDDSGKPRMTIIVEYNKKDWKIELNKTNQNFIRSQSLIPKEIIGKKLEFDKVKVRNPASGKMMDSLLLTDIAD